MRARRERPTNRAGSLIPPFLLSPLTSLAMNTVAGLVVGLVDGTLEVSLRLAVVAGIVTTVISYPATFVGGAVLLTATEDDVDGPSRSLASFVGAIAGLIAGGWLSLRFGAMAALACGGLGALYGAASGFVFVSLLPRRTTFRERLARIAARELALQEASR